VVEVEDREAHGGKQGCDPILSGFAAFLCAAGNGVP
jgi:hypothetical protein